MPDSEALRGRLTEAVRRDDGTTARGIASQLWQSCPTLSTAAFLSKALAESPLVAGWPTRRVFVLRSFTVEPLVPLLVAEGLAAGVLFRITVGDFNAYSQEILDPASVLYGQGVDLVLLAIQTRDVAPELVEGAAGRRTYVDVVDRVSGDLTNMLRVFRERSAAPIVLHSLDQPARAADGIFDAQRPDGQLGSILEINRRLLAAANGLPDVYLLDYCHLVARHGTASWFDRRLWETARLPVATPFLGPLAAEWARYLVALGPTVAKAVVCDLDNTLWGGVIGEDGPHGITVGVAAGTSPWLEVQRTLLDLYHRGILLAISSKNNPDDALAALADHPEMLLRPSHFAALRIGWEGKPQALSEIAAELMIGRDSLVFLDDNPAEREHVRQATPDVNVIELPDDPAMFADAIRRYPLFERLHLTNEDRDRGVVYAQQRERGELHKSCGSVEAYYRSLEMRLSIAPMTTATLARAAQLTQKTNQFNMTTRRYTEAELSRLAAQTDWGVYTVHVDDRFGDNGIVGLMITHHAADHWRIDSFLLSCRVIGRTIETAMLAWLARQARAAGVTMLVGEFIPTRKNMPAAGVYASHGFAPHPGDRSATAWSIRLADGTLPMPDWFAVRGAARQEASP